MPEVKWGYRESDETEMQWTRTASGGCFGFAGRHGVPSELTSIQPLIMRYDLRQTTQANLTPSVANAVSLDRILDYITTRSPWSKYVIQRNDAVSVDIRTDVPGHATIGTASVYRLACRYSYRSSFTRMWNYLVDNGVHEGVAFLLAYINNVHEGSPNATTFNVNNINNGRRGYSDNEPMCLQHMAALDVMKLLNNTWEYSVDDSLPAESQNYQYRRTYEQKILSSYKTPGFSGLNFPSYIKQRFLRHPGTSYALVNTQGGGGMGRSTSARRTLVSSPSYSLAYYLGIGLQLSYEYTTYGMFLGFDSEIKGAVDV